MYIFVYISCTNDWFLIKEQVVTRKSYCWTFFTWNMKLKQYFEWAFIVYVNSIDMFNFIFELNCMSESKRFNFRFFSTFVCISPH